MRRRIRKSSPTVLMAVTLLLIPLAGHHAMSQESDSSSKKSETEVPLQRSDVKQLFVPADQPQAWPKGNWEVVETQEYLRLLDGLKRKLPEPSPARIAQAKYQAIFTGKKLHAGQLRATIQQTTESQYLSLDPVNLAIESLWWDEGDNSPKAVWGNAANGETLLVLPQPGKSLHDSPEVPMRELRGTWSAAGQRFSNRFEFQLKLLPATVNELELYLPKAWALTSTVGLVEGPFELADRSQATPVPENLHDRFRQWKVQMGSERAGQLTFHQSSPGKPSIGLLLAESETTYLVHEQELQVEARYELEAAFAAVSQVVFELPKSVRIFAVTYGTETNLEWHERVRGDQRQVVIQLPDPLLGKSRPLRIQGLGKVESGKSWQLPMITCSQAALLRGELHLTVDAPLELRSYQATGFRQTAISVQPDQQETLTFSQIAPDRRARFTAYIGTPAFSVASQIVSRLTTGTEEWQMRSEVTWVVQAGSHFFTTCNVGPGWEILDVRRTSDSGLPVIADWRVLEGNKDKPAKLSIEFLEALTPMQSKRVLVLARRLPLTAGQTMSLACVEPQDCRSVEEFLWVESESSPSNIFVADVSSEVKQRKFETLPAFVRQSSAFSSQTSSDKLQDALVFYSKNGTSDDQLIVDTTEPPYKAEVSVSIDCTQTDIQESLVFAIEPLDSPIDRLTFSADDLGEDWNWDLPPQQPTLHSVPLQIERQESQPGEDREAVRWELRLPAPQTKPFQVVATRKRPLAGGQQLVLPFLSAARQFLGTVECLSVADRTWDFKTTGLEEVPILRSNGNPAAEINRWNYRSAEARMSIEKTSPATTQPPLLARLQFASILNGNSQSAIHRARYNFKLHSDEANFSFQLPEQGKLIEVLVNGTPIKTKNNPATPIRIPLPEQRDNTVEVRYETEWQTLGIVSSQVVPLPQTDVRILDFHWQFALSPDLKLADSPTGLWLMTSRPTTHWTRRFFGPLGRGSTVPFRPWNWSSWEGLFQTERRPSTKETESSDFLPADWAAYEARAPRIDQPLELKVWNQSKGLCWAWVALLTSTIIGFGLRIKSWTYRRHIGLFWFLINFAGAGLLPMPWAMISGGSLTGTLLALLFPRRFLFWQRKPAIPAIRPGSTISFEHQPIIMLALLFAVGLWSVAVVNLVFPQSAQGQQSSPAESPRRERDRSSLQEFHVLIPVEDPQNPQLDSSNVYVERNFLKRLQAAQPSAPPVFSYLISSAKYQTQTVQQTSVEITATYDVAVLTPQQTVTVKLPIDEVFLGGPGHCLVDGEPHPVLLDSESKGYLIELDPQPPGGPAIAERIHQTVPPTRNVETRQITLRLYGLVTSRPNGGRFSFSVPPVSSSEFRVRFPETYSSIGVRGLPGQIQIATESQSLFAKIGATKKLEVFWNLQANPMPPTNQPPLKVFALATISPLRIEWQIRVLSVPKRLSTSRAWHLPANTVVRELKSNHPVSFEVSSKKTSTELLIEFQDPAPEELALDLTCMTPRDPSSSALPQVVQIPALDLFNGFSTTELARGIEYQIGVVAAPELAMSPPSPDFLVQQEIHSISPEKFLTDFRQAATETRTLRSPQFAWRLTNPSGLELTQEPRLPTRRARVSQEGRIRKGELAWTFQAEIETTTAPAFRHILQVPASLIIDTVSVQEDETERLVRWSRLGNRVELVLSDGTTGNQSVELTGHRYFEMKSGTQISLPLIEIKEATIADSRLRIYQDFHADHELRLVGLDDLPSLDANVVKTERGIPRLLAGVHLTNSEVKPALTVGAPLDQIHLNQAIFIAAPNTDRYQMTIRFHLNKLEDSPQRFSVHLPASLTRDFRVELLQKPGEIVPYETITQPNQSLELVFDSVAFSEQDTLEIESFVAKTENAPWSLPQVDVTHAHIDDLVLGIPSSFSILSSNPLLVPSPLPEDGFPIWMTSRVTEHPDFTEIQLYRSPGESWQLVPNPSPNDHQPDPSIVQTTLWLTDPRAVVGETHVKLPERDREALRWSWPGNTSLRAALLDGEWLSPTIDRETRTLTLPIPSLAHSSRAKTERTLELYWAQELKTPLPRFGQIDLRIPKPQSETFQSATLKVLSSDRTEFIANEGFAPIVSPEQKTHSRDALKGSLPTSGDTWTISFWTMDSRAQSVLLVCVLVLLLGGGLHWGLRLNTGEWLHDHPAIAWALLGLIWWICLTGSFFGLTLVVLSPLIAIATKLQTNKSSEIQHNGSSSS